jgi:hypothetical protein
VSRAFWEAAVRLDELPKKIDDRRGGLSAGKMAASSSPGM